LAFLFPGAGHFYQGRNFKAIIYAVCIFGTYTYGLAMAGWHGIYTHKIEHTSQKKNLPFLAQTGVGLFGGIGWLQNQRYVGQEHVRGNSFPFDSGLDSSVTGEITFHDSNGQIVQKVEGEVNFPASSQSGTLTTTLDGKQEVFQLSNPESNALKIDADETWSLYASVVEEVNGIPRNVGSFKGEVPRSFLNWFCVPPEITTIDKWYNVYGGKRLDLAFVLTWIAGLLNFLVIWDALEGPAHGYGDEKFLNEKKPKEKNSEATEKTVTAEAPQSSG